MNVHKKGYGACVRARGDVCARSETEAYCEVQPGQATRTCIAAWFTAIAVLMCCVCPNHLATMVEAQATMLSPPRPSKNRPSSSSAYVEAVGIEEGEEEEEGEGEEGKGVTAHRTIPRRIAVLKTSEERCTPYLSMKTPLKKTRTMLGAE